VRVLVTRPHEDAEATAAALRARGHEVVAAPLLRVELLSADLGTAPWAAVLLTSANGVRAATVHPRCAELLKLPALAVGDRTAEAARTAGFAQVYSAAGDADDLVRLAAARFAGAAAPLLYPAGEQRSTDIVGALGAHGIAVHTVVSYRAVAVRDLPVEAMAALAARGIDGVLHFSPRSASTFLDVVRTAGLVDSALNCFHYCLSARVAAPLAAAGAARVAIASRPEEGALLDLIGRA